MHGAMDDVFDESAKDGRHLPGLAAGTGSKLREDDAKLGADGGGAVFVEMFDEELKLSKQGSRKLSVSAKMLQCDGPNLSGGLVLRRGREDLKALETGCKSKQDAQVTSQVSVGYVCSQGDAVDKFRPVLGGARRVQIAADGVGDPPKEVFVIRRGHLGASKW